MDGAGWRRDESHSSEGQLYLDRKLQQHGTVNSRVIFIVVLQASCSRSELVREENKKPREKTVTAKLISADRQLPILYYIQYITKS